MGYRLRLSLSKITPFYAVPIATLLWVALIFSHVFGSFQMIKLAHHHHVDGEHHHSHGEFHAVHHDDSSHQLPPAPGESDTNDAQSPEGETHSHVVSIGADGPIASNNSSSFHDIHSMGNLPYTEHDHGCPDGPAFELIKPPQLG